MKIVVDQNKCGGLAQCEAISHKYFRVESNGHLTILQSEVDAEDLDDVEDAVACCPTGSLSLED